MKLQFFKPKEPKFSKNEIRLLRKAFKAGINVGIEVLNEYEGKNPHIVVRNRFNELLKTIK